MQTFIYGGCCSGKSTFAETMLQSSAGGRAKYYLATMWPEGRDAQQRIERHRSMRDGKGFTTIEQYTNLAVLQLQKGCAVLLECIANLVANEMFHEGGAGSRVEEAVLAAVLAFKAQADHVIIISNEVGSDGVAYPAMTRAYQGHMANLNRILCETSDVSIEMVCGIPLYLKGGPTDRYGGAQWKQ